MTNKIKIKGGPVGVEGIWVNDAEVRATSAVLEMRRDEVHKLHLTSPVWENDIEIEGVVYVHSEVSNRDTMKAVSVWLRGLNAREIEGQALGLYGQDDSDPFAAKVIEILAQAAEVAAEK